MQVQPGIPSFPAPASDTIVLPDGTGNDRTNVKYQGFTYGVGSLVESMVAKPLVFNCCRKLIFKS